VWRRRTRRDVVLFGAGTVAALASARSFLPNVNRIDDEVAETLYSPRRTVPTYAKSQDLLRSKITTTELLPILGIFPDGV